jgi:DNA polymerase
MRTLFLDLETYSERELKSHGAWAYAESAEILLLAYAWDDDEVQVVEFPAPGMAQSLIDAADRIIIHNSHFDRTVLSFSQVRVPVERIYDTLAVGLLHSLPGALEKQCEVLGVPLDKAKDKAGKKLIQLFCKPQAKTRKLRRATKETHPAEWEAFKEYARMDIVAMREVYARQPKVNWTDAEKAVWRLDQAINDRGIQIDMGLAHAALRAAKEAGQRLATESARMTDGAVPSATQRDALIGYLREAMGLEIEDLRKGTLGALLKTDVPDDVRELLEVRLQAAATSPAKYRVLVRGTSSDGRLRGTMQYAGASRTGRFCLAEGTLVRVKDDTGRILERPIEDVTTDDLVWDGESWVRHEGVVFSGDKPVIAHDGVYATVEHKVYVSTSEHVTLGEAKQRGLPLWRGNATRFTG